MSRTYKAVQVIIAGRRKDVLDQTAAVGYNGQVPGGVRIFSPG